MCYLIAKKFNEEGSIVLQLEQGERLASLSRYLTLTTLEKGIQIVTLNNLDSYKEYTPYEIIKDEAEFISRILKM